MVDSTDPAWKIWGGRELELRYWDGDYVVYNPLNGSTHVLDIVAGEVLKAISDGHGQRSAADGVCCCGRSRRRGE